MNWRLCIGRFICVVAVLCNSSVASAESTSDASTTTSSQELSGPHRPTVGWIEKVSLYPGSIVLNAKLDTGADYSSLHAHDIEEFERDGVTWVRFDVIDRIGQHHLLEQPVIRTSLIKKVTGKLQRRNVIRLGICLGSIYMKSDVNLVDRSDFKLQMLVGRNFLAGNVAIDPAISFTSEPRCNIQIPTQKLPPSSFSRPSSTPQASSSAQKANHS